MKTNKLLLGSVILALTLAGGTAASASTIYLSNSGDGGTGKSVLYTVALDSATKKANLNTLATLNYDQVDAIARTPADDKIYFVDKVTKTLGNYDISAGTTTPVGILKDTGGTTLTDVVQAAFSPGGVLYVTTEYNAPGGGPANKVYTVNLGTARATLVGNLSGVDTQGNDLAFDSSGKLYLRSNAPTASQYKLYGLTIPATIPNPVTATLIGNTFAANGQGMAFDQDGNGNLLVAQPSSTNLRILNKTNGSLIDTYTFYLGSSSHTVTSGDMTGTLVPLPASVLLLGSGLLGIGLLGWRRKRS